MQWTLVRTTLQRIGRNFFWLREPSMPLGVLGGKSQAVRWALRSMIKVTQGRHLAERHRTGKSEATEFHKSEKGNHHIQRLPLAANRQEGFKARPPAQRHSRWGTGQEARFLGSEFFLTWRLLLPSLFSSWGLSPRSLHPCSAPRLSCRSPHSGLTFLGKSLSFWSSTSFPKGIINGGIEFGNTAICPGMAHLMAYSLSLFICKVGLITLTPQRCFKSKEENREGCAS